MNDGKYNIIYADPPWKFNARNNLKTKFGGGAGGAYPLIPDAELLAMAPFFADMMDDNCAVFMWASKARPGIALELLKAMGFNTTSFAVRKRDGHIGRLIGEVSTWVKTDGKGAPCKGTGHYNQSCCETLLLAIRGKMPCSPKDRIPGVVHYPRSKNHSEKPPIYRGFIERMYPSARKIELFARHTSDGWDTWGNQVGLLDDKTLKLEVA
jgi:N6-adenosine-specific RNA methylase IME4